MKKKKTEKQDFWGEPSFKPLLDYWSWKTKMLRKYVENINTNEKIIGVKARAFLTFGSATTLGGLARCKSDHSAKKYKMIHLTKKDK